MEATNEIEIPQLIKNVKDNARSFALISTYSENRNGFDNGCRLFSLKRTIRNDLKLGHYQLLISRLVEIDTTPKAQMVFDERVFMIYGISLKTALELGGKYNQLSIVFKSENRCDEICTSPFVDRSGQKHSTGDTIRCDSRHPTAEFRLKRVQPIKDVRQVVPYLIQVLNGRLVSLRRRLRPPADGRRN